MAKPIPRMPMRPQNPFGMGQAPTGDVFQQPNWSAIFGPYQDFLNVKADESRIADWQRIQDERDQASAAAAARARQPQSIGEMFQRLSQNFYGSAAPGSFLNRLGINRGILPNPADAPTPRPQYETGNRYSAMSMDRFSPKYNRYSLTRM